MKPPAPTAAPPSTPLSALLRATEYASAEPPAVHGLPTPSRHGIDHDSGDLTEVDEFLTEDEEPGMAAGTCQDHRESVAVVTMAAAPLKRPRSPSPKGVRGYAFSSAGASERADGATLQAAAGSHGESARVPWKIGTGHGRHKRLHLQHSHQHNHQNSHQNNCSGETADGGRSTGPGFGDSTELEESSLEPERAKGSSESDAHQALSPTTDLAPLSP